MTASSVSSLCRPWWSAQETVMKWPGDSGCPAAPFTAFCAGMGWTVLLRQKGPEPTRMKIGPCLHVDRNVRDSHSAARRRFAACS